MKNQIKGQLSVFLPKIRELNQEEKKEFEKMTKGSKQLSFEQILKK